MKDNIPVDNTISVQRPSTHLTLCKLNLYFCIFAKHDAVFCLRCRFGCQRRLLHHQVNV